MRTRLGPLGDLTKEEMDRLSFDGYPNPPADRIYRNGRLIQRYSVVKALMGHRTLRGDLLKLELSWRQFKREVSRLSVIRNIVKYLK